MQNRLISFFLSRSLSFSIFFLIIFNNEAVLQLTLTVNNDVLEKWYSIAITEKIKIVWRFTDH